MLPASNIELKRFNRAWNLENLKEYEQYSKRCLFSNINVNIGFILAKGLAIHLNVNLS